MRFEPQLAIDPPFRPSTVVETAVMLAARVGLDESISVQILLGPPGDEHFSTAAIEDRAGAFALLIERLHLCFEGKSEVVARWLTVPHPLLEHPPLDLLETRAGFDEVVAYVRALTVRSAA